VLKLLQYSEKLSRIVLPPQREREREREKIYMGRGREGSILTAIAGAWCRLSKDDIGVMDFISYQRWA
jgi:hypothetical protein